MVKKKSTKKKGQRKGTRKTSSKGLGQKLQKKLLKGPLEKRIPRRKKKTTTKVKTRSSKKASKKQTKKLDKKNLKKPVKGKKPKYEILEDYQLNVDDATVNVRIEKRPEGRHYILEIPEIKTGTHALIEEIRRELITLTAVGAGEILDQKSANAVKKDFMQGAKKILKQKIPSIDQKTQDFLVGILIQEMLGLGNLEFLINDENLEEIVIISSREPVRAYHKKLGWLITNIKPKNEEETVNYSNIIARRVGRQISVLNPLLDAHIVTGDRANSVLYPIATKGNTITIRKFARDPWTIIDLISNKTCSLDVASILWLAIEFEMNVLISGGTASGKTVFLNACMPFIPPNNRVISMEDTRELMLPEFLYWCPLVTRSPNIEGKGEVSMLDLLVNSLRMRPDRIILGEIRRQREAEVLFEAMHTGHSVYATVHADSANETIRRLTNPPINVPDSMLKSVNLNVIMFRDRRKGVRRVHQVGEFMPGKERTTANILYRWIPDRDEIVAHNESIVFYDELSRHTGMSQREIKEDLEKRKTIMAWMIDNKIRDLNSLGKLMTIYYNDKDLLQEVLKKNQTEKVIYQKQKNTAKEKMIEGKEISKRNEDDEKKEKSEEEKTSPNDKEESKKSPFTKHSKISNKKQKKIDKKQKRKEEEKQIKHARNFEKALKKEEKIQKVNKKGKEKDKKRQIISHKKRLKQVHKELKTEQKKHKKESKIQEKKKKRTVKKRRKKVQRSSKKSKGAR